MHDLGPIFASPWGALLIFLLRIVDVSCDTMRVIFTIRGRRAIAGALGFVQALVWIFAVGNAVRHLDSWLHILAYAAGYAAGTMVGITIEHALAFGLATVRIVSSHGGVEIADAMRGKGYGVTEFGGFGHDGRIEMVHSVVQRSHLREVMAIVDQFDPDAFVTVEEPKFLRGGKLVARDSLMPDAFSRLVRLRERA